MDRIIPDGIEWNLLTGFLTEGVGFSRICHNVMNNPGGLFGIFPSEIP